VSRPSDLVDAVSSPRPSEGESSFKVSRCGTLFVLFWEMILLAAFVLGGGYVILSVADRRFSRKKWIREGELFEALPLFQMIPGIIGGHTAVYLGNRVAGLVGSAVALAGMVLPSVLIFLAISLCYKSIPVGSPLMSALFLGLRAALTGTIVEIAVRQWRKSVTGVYGYLAVVVGVAALMLGVSPGRVIVAGMLAGLAVTAARQCLSQKPLADAPRVFRSFWAIPLLFFGYGLMAFGGGFVLVPAYLRDFVGAAAPYLQLPSADFANIMALTQMTPGPVAANCATFFGYSLGGVSGAFLATVCLLLPGSIILWLALRSLDRFRTSVIVRGLFFGVRPITMALIVSASWSFAGMSVWHATPTGCVFSPLGAALALGTLAAVGTRRLGAVVAILLSALVALACGAFLPCVL